MEKLILEKENLGKPTNPNICKNNDWTYTSWINCRKIKEEEIIKPRFKVWDYVVRIPSRLSFCKIEYLKIKSIYHSAEWYYYNGWLEDSLREPTEKELEIYFK